MSPQLPMRMTMAPFPGPKTDFFSGKTRAEGTGFEPATPFGASDFESDRWPIRLPSTPILAHRCDLSQIPFFPRIFAARRDGLSVPVPRSTAGAARVPQRRGMLERSGAMIPSMPTAPPPAPGAFHA